MALFPLHRGPPALPSSPRHLSRPVSFLFVMTLQVSPSALAQQKQVDQPSNPALSTKLHPLFQFPTMRQTMFRLSALLISVGLSLAPVGRADDCESYTNPISREMCYGRQGADRNYTEALRKEQARSNSYGLKICNNSSDTIYALSAYPGHRKWRFRGRYTIGKGTCMKVLSESLANGDYYYYIERKNGSRANKTDKSFEVGGSSRWFENVFTGMEDKPNGVTVTVNY